MTRLFPPPRAASLAAVLALLAASPVALAAPPGSDAARSRELFRKAAKEYEQGKPLLAYEDYLAAWQLQKSYDIAGNLANVELELGKPRLAAEHAAYALENFPPVGTDKQRAFLEDLFKKAKQQVGTVSILISPEGAAVTATLDGQPLPEASLRGAEIYLDPGPHELSVTAPGLESIRRPVIAEKGLAFTLRLTMTPPIEPQPLPPPAPEPRRLGPVVIGGIVVTGIAAGLGATFAALSAVKASDADAAMHHLQGEAPGSSTSACAGASPSAACRDLHSLRQSRDTFANASLWTFIGAGALGAGTLVYGLVGAQPSPSRSAGSVRLVPALGPTGGGATLGGSF